MRLLCGLYDAGDKKGSSWKQELPFFEAKIFDLKMHEQACAHAIASWINKIMLILLWNYLALLRPVLTCCRSLMVRSPWVYNSCKRDMMKLKRAADKLFFAE